MLFPSLFHAASVSVILSQSQHFTNLWHNDKYWFSLQRDSTHKTILFKLILYTTFQRRSIITFIIYKMPIVFWGISLLFHILCIRIGKELDRLIFGHSSSGFISFFFFFFLHWLDKRHMVGQRVWIIDKLASRCMYVQIDARQSPSGSSQYNLVCLYIVGETEQIQ